MRILLIVINEGKEERFSVFKIEIGGQNE